MESRMGVLQKIKVGLQYNSAVPQCIYILKRIGSGCYRCLYASVIRSIIHNRQKVGKQYRLPWDSVIPLLEYIFKRNENKNMFTQKFIHECPWKQFHKSKEWRLKCLSANEKINII
jgi:hypothetical protein